MTVHYGPLVQTTPAQLDDVLRSEGDRRLAPAPRCSPASRSTSSCLFSSASGVLSSPLVGAYAAANAFLDALAHRRASEGRPALSVDWGLWAGAGMAEQVDAEGLAALTARGMGSLAPEQALEALGALLGSSGRTGRRHPGELAGVARALPDVHRRRHSWPRCWPARPRSPTTAEAAVAREDLLALEPAARAEAVRRGCARTRAAVLRLDPATLDVHEPLTAFGIDSLMAVELKNRVDRDLGLSVPLVHYLDGSDLGRLAEVLLDNVDAAHRTGVTPDTLDTAAAASC